MADISEFSPSKGLLTFGLEGNEGGAFHSRKFQVPTGSSGLTIGRGYDMKERKKSEIKSDLMAAGLSEKDAETISGAAGLSGDLARKFIKDKNLESFEIEPSVQLKLFNIAYDEKAVYAKYLCSKPDVKEKYGPCNWETMNSTIKEIVIDMTYRGEYIGEMRTKIQDAVLKNDLETVREVLAVKGNFGNIDSHRFNTRLQKINQEIAVKKVDNKRSN